MVCRQRAEAPCYSPCGPGKPVPRSRVRLLLACALLPALAHAQGPHRYALLVGVGRYEHLAPELQLSGPRNDVSMMRVLLLRQGFPADTVRVLADGADGSRGAPTRTNILAEIDGLAAAAEEGDFVLLYYAGHGTQVWAPHKRAREEADGYDEMILPADVGRWDGARRRVEGAILDDEIGARISALASRGAQVWAIFDTCHAGTMTRAGQVADERSRGIDATLLGAAAAPAGAPAADPVGGLRWSGAGGDLPAGARVVAFYASDAAQAAGERPLPPRGPLSRWHGVFTYALVTALAREPRLSYRELAARIAAQLSGEFAPAAAPAFEVSDDALSDQAALPVAR